MKRRTMLERNDHVLTSAAELVENVMKVLVVVSGFGVVLAQGWHLIK